MPPSLQRGTVRVSGITLRTDHAGLTQSHLLGSSAHRQSAAGTLEGSTSHSGSDFPKGKVHHVFLKRVSDFRKYLIVSAILGFPSRTSFGPQLSGDATPRASTGQPSDAEIFES